MAHNVPKIDAVAALVAGGTSVTEAAEQVGVSRRTATRWAGTDQFKLAVARVRGEVVSSALGGLGAGLKSAVATMNCLLNDTDAKIRLASAKAMFESFARLTVVAELEQRLAQIE